MKKAVFASSSLLVLNIGFLLSYWFLHKLLIIPCVIFLIILWKETKNKIVLKHVWIIVTLSVISMSYDKTRSKVFFPVIGKEVEIDGIACFIEERGEDGYVIGATYSRTNCVRRSHTSADVVFYEVNGRIKSRIVKVDHVVGLGLSFHPYVKTIYGEVGVSGAFRWGEVIDLENNKKLQLNDVYNPILYKITTLLIPRFPIW